MRFSATINQAILECTQSRASAAPQSMKSGPGHPAVGFRPLSELHYINKRLTKELRLMILYCRDVIYPTNPIEPVRAEAESKRVQSMFIPKIRQHDQWSSKPQRFQSHSL